VFQNESVEGRKEDEWEVDGMKKSVAIAKEADSKKESSPTRSDNSIQRLRNEPERQLGSLRAVIGNIRRNGGTPSVESISTELSVMPSSDRASALLAIQQTHGNQYVQRVVTGIQAKLKIGQPGDKYEQEADRVAEQVMEMPEPQVQRQPEEDEEKEHLQTKGLHGQTSEVTIDIESSVNSLRGSGPHLPELERTFFEQRLGHDFSRVRIHTDAKADTLNRAIDARAFTTGQDIFFRQGVYSPGSSDGRELLAHELTHVVQQSGGISLKRAIKNTFLLSSSTKGSTSNFQKEINQFQSKLSPHQNSVPSIQADFAIEPPNPAAQAVILTNDQIQDAINYNSAKLRRADAALIGTLRDVLGISREPSVIDADFVNAVVRWQAVNNLSQEGKLGPDTAAPLFRELRAEGLTAESRSLANLVRRGRVRTAPVYAGALAPVPAGAVQIVTFTFAAEFEDDPENGIFANCCEIRQQIQWDAAMAASFNAAYGNPVPHAGFPAAHPADDWIEDRDATDTLRYGHRRGAHSNLVPGNQYLDSRGNPNPNGRRYEGIDSPETPCHGQMQFRIYVVDVCNGGRRISPFNTITINW
jgi:hypothetical protein